jgi:hypothetical protein
VKGILLQVAAVLCVFLSTGALPALSQSSRREPALSAGEARVIDMKIESMRSVSDRKVAREWSNAKKVAEVICRPHAISYWKKTVPGTERVLLGTSDPATLVLESDRKLTGSGQYRTSKGWTDFNFTCELNPDRGRVSKFEVAPVIEAKK